MFLISDLPILYCNSRLKMSFFFTIFGSFSFREDGANTFRATQQFYNFKFEDIWDDTLFSTYRYIVSFTISMAFCIVRVNQSGGEILDSLYCL